MSKKTRRLENRKKATEKNPIQVPTVVEQTVPATPAAKTEPKKIEKVQVKSEPKTELFERGVGYVVEIASDNGKTLYFKVVTPHPINDEYVTALAYKPTTPAVIGAKINLDLVPHFNKWSATNVRIAEEKSVITPYVEQLAQIENEVIESNTGMALFPSQVASMILKSPHRTGNLCQDLGFKQILGRVQGGSKIQFA